MPSRNLPEFLSKCSGILPEFQQNHWNRCRIPLLHLSLAPPSFFSNPVTRNATLKTPKDRLGYLHHHIGVELIDPQTTLRHVVFFTQSCCTLCVTVFPSSFNHCCGMMRSGKSSFVEPVDWDSLPTCSFDIYGLSII